MQGSSCMIYPCKWGLFSDVCFLVWCFLQYDIDATINIESLHVEITTPTPHYFTDSWNTDQTFQAMVLPIRASSFGVGVKKHPPFPTLPPTPKLEVIPLTSFDYPHSNFVFLSIRHTGGCLSGRFYTSTYWLVTTFHAYPAWRNTWRRKFLDKLED